MNDNLLKGLKIPPYHNVEVKKHREFSNLKNRDMGRFAITAWKLDGKVISK